MMVSCISRASETTRSPKHCQGKNRRIVVRFASSSRNTLRIKNCPKQYFVFLNWAPCHRTRKDWVDTLSWWQAGPVAGVPG